MTLKTVLNHLLSKLIYTNPKKRARWLKSKGYKFGENCEVFSGVTFGSEFYLIQLGDNVKLTYGVTFIPHDGGVHVLRNLKIAEKADYFGKIIIGNNVFVGNHAIILPGITIGDNCIIGAGSIVTKDIPSNSVAAGVPARVICSIEQYANKHMKDFDYTHGFTPEEKRVYLYKKYNMN